MDYRIIVLMVMTLLSFSLKAQNVPIGTWQNHHPFTNGIDVCASKKNIYCASLQSVFSININDNAITVFTKANGLNDMGIAAIGYDTSTSSLIIVYTNANIDIVQNGKTYNVPYLKNALITADKNVKDIFAINGKAYLATGFGMVLLDLNKKEVSDSYFFITNSGYLSCNSILSDENGILAATDNGLYLGEYNRNLLNFSSWQLMSGTNDLPSGATTAITKFQNKWTVAVNAKGIYAYNGSIWELLEQTTDWTTVDISAQEDKLAVAQQKLNFSGGLIDKRIGVKIGNENFVYENNGNYIQIPKKISIDAIGNVWYADLFRSLVKYENGDFGIFYPNGPLDATNNQMAYFDKKIYVSGSPISRNITPTGSRAGLYVYDGIWQNYNPDNTAALASAIDISIIEPIPNEKKLLLGANGSGLLEINLSDWSGSIINKPQGASSNYRITGMVTDNSGNIWIANSYSSTPIICRKKSGEYEFFSNNIINGKPLNDIAVDDNGQIWVTILDGGMAVLNYGNNIEDKSDDVYISYNTNAGTGGLSTNAVWCVSKDNNGDMWVGTSEGIALVSCTAYVFDRQCDATKICVPRNDGTRNCDNLLEDELVTCIKIDAANRKWIGTNNGVFLVSADGLQTIYYFNKDNSPLLSNGIKSIEINQENGDVFFATDKGLSTFRGEATTTTNDASKPYAYPNPVYHDYEGVLSVRNMPNNADVNITDSGGRLVYKSSALGGQVIWDMRDFDGNKVATGVYFITGQGIDKKDNNTVKVLIIR